MNCEYRFDETVFHQEGVAVYRSAYFGKILIEDDRALYCEHDCAMRHESMVHTAVCTHAEPRRALVIDGGDGAAVHELLKHKHLAVDVIERDETIVAAGRSMALIPDVWADERVSLQTGDTVAMLAEMASDHYDLLFFNRFDELYLDDEAVMRDVERVLTKQGIVVMEASSQMFDMAAHTETLAALGRHFKIVMPFRYLSMVRPGGEQWFVMGSNHFHPTADIQLQRADLTDGFEWYNADLHIAQFALPTATFRRLQGLVKR